MIKPFRMIDIGRLRIVHFTRLQKFRLNDGHYYPLIQLWFDDESHAWELNFFWFEFRWEVHTR